MKDFKNRDWVDIPGSEHEGLTAECNAELCGAYPLYGRVQTALVPG